MWSFSIESDPLLESKALCRQLRGAQQIVCCIPPKQVLESLPAAGLSNNSKGRGVGGLVSPLIGQSQDVSYIGDVQDGKVKGNYVSINSSCFRDFLLKPEVQNAAEQCRTQD